MRVNIYAEEMPEEPRIEIIEKEVDGNKFTALRIYLELPATVRGKQYQGPFIHRPGDDDSAAVTFWGKRDLRKLLRKALAALNKHYAKRDAKRDPLRDNIDGCCEDAESGCEDCEVTCSTCAGKGSYIVTQLSNDNYAV